MPTHNNSVRELVAIALGFHFYFAQTSYRMTSFDIRMATIQKPFLLRCQTKFRNFKSLVLENEKQPPTKDE